MKIVLTVLILFTFYISSLCQGGEYKARINALKGEASFRVNKDEKEVIIPKNKVGMELFPGQEVRCRKNCTLELKLCTNEKIMLNEADSWYRIPDIVCKQDNAPPGFNEPNRDLDRGGRSGVARYNGSNYLYEARTSDATAASSVTSPVTRDVNPAQKRDSARIDAILRRLNSNYYQYYYYKYFPIVNYSDRWFFKYPYNGARVIPELFIFDIDTRKAEESVKRINLLVSLSAFENENSLRISREWKKELVFQTGVLKNSKGEIWNPQEVKSFLEDVRKYYGGVPARIYCTITVGELSETNNVVLNPHSFGFEFFVMTIENERLVLNQLEQANKETGIVLYLGRGDIFEKLGLIKLAISEYTEALKLYPDNVEIKSRLEGLQRITVY